MFERVCPKHDGGIGHAQGQSWMAGVCLLHSVECQAADGVGGALIEFGK